MKTDRIIWGIILLFVGGVLLLENFNIIEFYWRSVWRFWPIFLIIAGINVLFSKNRSQLGGFISIGVLVVTLGFLFYRGQQKPENREWLGMQFNDNIDLDFDNGNHSGDQRMMLSEAYTDSLSKKIQLNISGGGTSFDLDGGTDSLITADVKSRKANFSLMKMVKDSATTVTLKMQDKNGKQKWSLGDGGNEVDLRLNKAPEWDINMSMGAGEINFNLSDYKVRTFKFDGGAAALDIKVGALLPITDVFVKTGVADVKIQVPEGSGCRIQSKSGLSARDFSGFNKLSDGVYETSNYKTSTQKIFITLDGGLSNFEVKRY
jgi:hypothetical protein